MNTALAIVRIQWIEDQLTSGRRWNASILAAEFGVCLKTAQRTVDLFRTTHRDWDIRFDRRHRTYYLENSLPVAEKPCKPECLEMNGTEFTAIRDRLCLSQDQLASCLQTPQSRISAWELGKQGIPTDIVFLMHAWDRARKFGHWRGRQRRRIRA